MTTAFLMLSIVWITTYETPIDLTPWDLELRIPTVVLADLDRTRLPTDQDPRQVWAYRGNSPYHFRVIITATHVPNPTWESMVGRLDGNVQDVLHRLALLEAGQNGLSAVEAIDLGNRWQGTQALLASHFREDPDLTEFITDAYIVDERESAEDLTRVNIFRIRLRSLSPNREMMNQILTSLRWSNDRTSNNY